MQQLHVFRRKTSVSALGGEADPVVTSAAGRGSVADRAPGRAVGAVSLKVKNTFLDDEVQPDEPDPIIFRSMPAALPDGMMPRYGRPTEEAKTSHRAYNSQA